MKLLLVLWSFIFLGMLGCGESGRIEHRSNLSPNTRDSAREIPNADGYRLGNEISSGNLTVIPVLYTPPQGEMKKQLDDYATLSEAKKNGWIEIIEKPGEEEVSFLQVRNLGPKPILLLGGELLIGGKQDRIVAKDSIVSPGETKEVPVYCVEHGRWEGTSKKFTYSGTAVPNRVRNAAMYEGQQEVWNKVKEYNEMTATPDRRSTVQAGLNDKKIQARISRSLDEILRSLSREQNAVGAIVLINNEIQTLEVFGSSKLFTNSIDGLLRGAIAEAAITPATRPGTIDWEACRSFVSDSLNETYRVAKDAVSHDVAKMETESVQGRAVVASPQSESAGAADKSIIHGSFSNRR